MITKEEYRQAERELALREGRRAWRIHAVVYALVNAGLIGLNLALIAWTDAGFVWFPFPLVGWGIGLTFHYLYGVRWAERELRGRQDAVEAYAETRKAA
jgi:hypothetical protein